MQLAADFHLHTVAEGVEELEQLEILRDFGCDSVQGFLFARPQPLADIVKLLATGLELPATAAIARRSPPRHRALVSTYVEGPDERRRRSSQPGPQPGRRPGPFLSAEMSMTTDPDKPLPPAGRHGAGGGRSHHRAWLAAAALVVALGGIASVLASTSVARGNASGSHQSFASSSPAIAATLQLSILHEQDLMNSAAGFIADDPYASNVEFGQWAVTVNAFARYPEVMGFAYSVIVPAAGPVFASVVESDPAGVLAPNGPGGHPAREAFVLLPHAVRSVAQRRQIVPGWR